MSFINADSTCYVRILI